MDVNIVLYGDTGFNSGNIPDNQKILYKCDILKRLKGYNLVQTRFLTSVRVKAKFGEIKSCDYVQMTSDDISVGELSKSETGWFYFVKGINQLNTDVCELILETDYITSAGGVETLHFADGVTERVHVPSDDDDYGAYDLDDALLAPQEPLSLVTDYYNGGSSYTTVIESTINPIATYYKGESKNFSTTVAGETVSVNIPYPQPADDDTIYALGNKTIPMNTGTELFPVEGTWNTSNMKKGLSLIRGLGVEQAIISQVQYPSGYVTLNTATIQESGYDEDGNSMMYNYEYVTSAIGKSKASKTFNGDDRLKYEYFTSYQSSSGETIPVNNRINYSPYMKYGLITCSGESCEYNPSDIYNYKNPTTYPQITINADPHTDGKPYFRFKCVNKDSSDIGFWRNCVSGMQWKQVPLVFREVSGNILNTMKMQNSLDTTAISYGNTKRTLTTEGTNAQLAYDTGLKNLGLQVGTNASNMINQIGSSLFGGVASGTSTGVGAVTSAAQSMNSLSASLQQTTNTLSTATENARQTAIQDSYTTLLNSGIENTITVPTVNFPYNSEIIRDTYGNGVICYRYVYSNSDMKRINKLLNQYGYKVTKSLQQSDFTNRSKFNYVKCSDVSVTGHPKWVNDGIANQLLNGVRIWHVKPSVGYYTDGSNV